MLVSCLLASLTLAGTNAPTGHTTAPPAWDVDPADYQFRMDLVIRLEYQNTPTNDPGNLIGVFVGSELRGVATPIDIGGEMYFFTTVYSNEYTGENLRFRAYYAPDDEVYAIVDTVVFVNYGIIGSFMQPYWLNIDPTLDFPPEILPILADTTLQTIPFEPLDLNGRLLSVDGDPVMWSALAGPNLTAVIVNDTLIVEPVSPAWTGTDTVRIIVKENTPGQLADTFYASFTVLPDYGPPSWQTVPSQAIFGGSAFTPFDLDDYLTFAGPCRAFDLNVFPFTGTASNPNWPAVAPAPQVMTITARPLFVDLPLAGAGAQLAAYVNGVLAATATPTGTPPNVFYTLELQNVASGAISFQFYHAAEQFLYEKNTTLTFSAGGSLGTVAAPYPIQLSPLVPVLTANGEVEIQIVDSTWRGIFPIDFIVWDCDYPLLRRDTTTATFSIEDNNNPAITSSPTATFEENACYEVYDTQTLDPNDAEGSGLSYSIEGGNDDDKFSIDPVTGVLSWLNFTPDFANPADADLNNDYEVTIRVTNQLNLTDDINLVVTVTEDTDGPFNPQVTGGSGQCISGGSAVLEATGGDTYLWSTTETTASITVTNAGMYSVTVTDAAACSAVLSVNLSIAPTITALGNTGLVCQGTNIVLSSNPTGGTGVYSNFSWTGPDGFASSAQNPTPFTATPASSGTYTVEVTDNGGCTASATVSISVSPNNAPSIAATGSSPVCAGQNISLGSTASGGSGTYSQYRWSGPNNFTAAQRNPFPFVSTVAASGAYIVTVTDNQGCTASDTVTVLVNPLPTVTATGNGPLCAGATVVLGATPAGGSGTYSSFSWTGPNGFTANVEDPAPFAGGVVNSGLYTVTVTDNAGCSASRTVTVSITANPTLTAMAIGPTCEGGNLALGSTPSGGTAPYPTFTWSGPNGFSATTEDPAPIPAIPGASGMYNVTVIDNAGCSATANTSITIYPVPSITAQSNGPVCAQAQLTLSSTPSGGSGVFSLFSWSGPDNYVASVEDPAGFTTTTASGGTYQVIVTDNRGCTAVATTNVSIKPKPSATASNNGPLCQGATVSLSVQATGGSGTFSGYSWSGPDGYTASGQNPPGFQAWLINSGVYQVTVTDDAGCTATATTTLSVSSGTSPSITASSNAPLCQGSILQLTSSPAGGTPPYTSFQWSGPDGFSSNAQNPPGFAVMANDAGVYSVTVTDQDGCKSAATVNVEISQLMANASNIGTCADPNVTLTCAPTGGSGVYTQFLWSGPNGYSSADQNPAPFTRTTATEGNYTVSVTDNQGCSTTGTTFVQVSDIGPPTITCPANTASLPPDPGVCTADVMNIDATVSDDCSSVSVAYVLTGVTTGSGNGQASGETFDEGITTVTYTATDGANNTSTCSFNVTVASCTRLSGNILWSQNGSLGVKDATVTATGGGTGSDVTDVSGNYIIVPVGTGNITITPVKNINKFNGVTMADVTRIQQHVSGNGPFLGAPFPRIAADVNKSNSINTSDAGIITQALLGSPAANAQWTVSWRFVDDAYVFPNPNAPWNFPENITVTGVTPGAQITGKDFIGVKLGDVAAPVANPALRTALVVLRGQDQPLVSGETITVPLRVEGFENIAAFQFVVHFDTSRLSFDGVTLPGGGLLAPDDFGTYFTDNGELRAAYARAEGTDIQAGASFFTVHFAVRQSGGLLSEAISLAEDLMPAEAYTPEIDVRPIQLVLTQSSATGNQPGELTPTLTAQPNPAHDHTNLHFTLPAAGEAALRVFDVNGRLVTERHAFYQPGAYVFAVEFAQPGLYVAELRTAYGVQVVKVVVE
ncbi:MAG: T9SS type A sorting domain-containing protein [Saprospiraceae bacterium]|nr:T9SS type A sorting domain-containing protein [Saprospiraceae bacterium]